MRVFALPRLSDDEICVDSRAVTFRKMVTTIQIYVREQEQEVAFSDSPLIGLDGT